VQAGRLLSIRFPLWPETRYNSLKRVAKTGDLAILAPARFAVLGRAIGWADFVPTWWRPIRT
jgi:hypothetical protein